MANIYTQNVGSKLDSFLRKNAFLFLFTLLRNTAHIISIIFIIIVRVFCPRAGLSPQTREPTILIGMNGCGSFPFLSAPYFLFNI